jgi:hypothetical protein
LGGRRLDVDDAPDLVGDDLLVTGGSRREQ